MQKIKLPMVELFYGHLCNLSCRGCTSASDLIKHKNKDPSLDSIYKTIDDLAAYVEVDAIDLMGGEIFLYWDTVEKIANRIREKFPKAVIGLGTNGLLLNKYQDKIIEFCEKYHPCVIDITDHFSLFSEDVLTTEFKDKIKNFIKNTNSSIESVIQWGVVQEDVTIFKNQKFKTRIAKAKEFYPCYYIADDNKIKPHSTNDPNGSYANGCAMPSCHLAVDSKLYKCSWFSMLPKMLEITNQLDDKDWQPYLNYQPVDLSNPTQQDLINFYITSTSSISLCDMCSNNKKNSLPHTKDNVLNKSKNERI